jgi:SSS family solute:Na+ symporter
MNLADWLVLAGYFVALTAVGIISMRFVKAQEDYFMGSRKFGRLLQTFAAFGAGTGAHEPVQVGRTVWTSGLSGIWSALMWLFVTPVYWVVAVWYRRMRHLTLGDWFVERYESPAMGAAYTLFAVVYYMFLLSSMFSAIGQVGAPLIGQETVYLGMGQPLPLEYVLVPVIGALVIFYGVLGGLKAAYWTDLLQGIGIILLSILLIPYGLWRLVQEYGNPKTMNVWDGFEILHSRLDESYFMLFGGPAAGEFPIGYIISLSLVVLIGIVVNPHFIATGGGSARSETHARIGLVTGNFLKRLCTVGWGLTGLIALVLLADSVVLAQDPDQVWGLATKTILGPIGFGLVGLMLACLLAALMSSADCYMIVTSGCVVRNVYAQYINPHASERTYVLAGRLTGLVIIVGATVVSLLLMDVFGQFKLAVELPLLFAAPFWVGMWWRRAGPMAAWGTIGFTLCVFFIVPVVAPWLIDDLRQNQRYAQTTPIVETTVTRPAKDVDVSRRAARIELWQQRQAEIREMDNSAAREQALAELGPKPEPIEQGQSYEQTTRYGGQAVFWRDGVRPADGGDPSYRVVERRQPSPTKRILVKRYDEPMVGQGSFNAEFLLYRWLGMELNEQGKGTLETLRLPPRLITPFVLVVGLSLLTPSASRSTLDRFFAKMKTPVQSDPGADRAAVAEAAANPQALETQKVLPGTNLEMQKPTKVDCIGFVVAVIACALVVGLAWWVGTIGAG